MRPALEPDVEADWSVEIGASLPMIDADWPGFVDLRLTSVPSIRFPRQHRNRRCVMPRSNCNDPSRGCSRASAMSGSSGWTRSTRTSSAVRRRMRSRRGGKLDRSVARDPQWFAAFETTKPGCDAPRAATGRRDPVRPRRSGGACCRGRWARGLWHHPLCSRLRSGYARRPALRGRGFSARRSPLQ